ncbi:MAG: hypothetical protein ACKPH9_26020, partial [Dolichospermum sp.]
YNKLIMFPITFQLKHQPNLKLLDIVNLYGSSPRRNIIDIQNRFFQSFLFMVIFNEYTVQYLYLVW